MKALSQIFAARRGKIRYISRPAPRISYSMAHYNGIMWPDRRQILKRTPLLFAAGLTFAALPKIERCSASGSRGYPMGGDPSQPTVAESAGFNENVFYDNFSSPQTVDLYNTFAPGFKWYLNRPSDNTPSVTWQTAPSDLSFGANGLTFISHYDSGLPTTRGSSLATLGFDPLNNSTVGVLIAPNGGYFEAQMSFNPTYPDICDQAIAFWLAGADMGALVHASKINNNLRYTEVDILEMLGVSCSALGAFVKRAMGKTISPNMAVHEWLNGKITSTGGGIQNLGTFDYTQFHKYGFLWKTIAQNGGTQGLYQWYVDGGLINTVNYESGGLYSSSETQDGFNMILQTGKDWALNIKQVTVWQ
jgi:hypothetical protein